MQIRLANEITFDSIVDGPGLRCVIWTQGCPHQCVGCHNPQTHDINAGFLVDTSDVISAIEGSKLQHGITLSGGEPFLQATALLEIVSVLKPQGFNIWAYTGFLFEDLLKQETARLLLTYIDVLVDGKFEEDKKSYMLKFKGSSNQRVIDVQASLKQQQVVLQE